MDEKKHEFEVIVSEEEPIQVYSNALTITPTPFDFQIKFSTQTINANKNIATFKDICTVFLSPQHAKVFSQLLQKQITEYERTNGEIAIPLDIAQPLNVGVVKQ